jgi:amidase
MTQPLWRLSATDLALRLRQKDVSALEVAHSVLARIDDVNPRINALVDLMRDEALAAAAAADKALAQGLSVGPLHGVPISTKVNVDTAGRATTDGVVAAKDNIALSDSPLVASLRAAGAVIIGRSNTPAFSLRWFTDNDLHGRTLNPFDDRVTPGGSSGGAAAAVAMGMGAIAHGNDYGGSIRYPAWACGVVGLRTTAGRVPSYKASAPNRIMTNQMMSVQGPLTRTVADARLALQVMAQGSPLDPNWVPAPLNYADTQRPLRVAVFKRHAAYDVDPTVTAAVEQAAQWLAAAGCEIEEVEPPHFEEGAFLWRQMVMDDMRRGGQPAMEAMADLGTRSALRGYMDGLSALDRDQTLDMQMRRFNICRDWAVFFEQYPVLLMPNSWQRQFQIDADKGGPDQVHQLLAAQAPLLGTAMMGLPGLSVPTGVVNGLPVGVQLVTGRFREDLALRAGEMIELAAGYAVLDHLAPL